MSELTLTAASHFHPLTNSLFELVKCAFCNGTAAASVKILATMPSGVKIWGEPQLPARTELADDLETDCCTTCRGLAYYIENVKSEWAVIHRQTGAVATLKKSEKAARIECDKLNNPPPVDSAPVAVNDAVESNLTTDLSTTKLPGMVVIRLAGDLPNGLKRGHHVQLPIDKLTALITETGATPMAKPTDRKTAKDLIRALIIKKKTDDAIIAEVQAAFPESSVDKKHCTKYRRELLVEGLIGAELAAVGSPDHREWAAANPALAKKGPHAEYHKAAEAKAKETAKAKPAAAAKPTPVAKAPAKAAAAKAPAKSSTGSAKAVAAKKAGKGPKTTAPKATTKAKPAPKAKASVGKTAPADALEI
jgi:hypothetical protein